MRAPPQSVPRAIGDGPGRRQEDATRPVGGDEPFDRAVGIDGPDGRVDPGEQALRLAQRVAEEQAGRSRAGVGGPPGVDVREDLRVGRPAEDGQAEGRLTDEGVAAHRLERGAGGARPGPIVAGDDRDLAPVGQADLCRAQDVAGRVQGDLHPIHVDRLTVGHGLDHGGVTQARTCHRQSVPSHEIGGAARLKVVGVRVRDHRARDSPPGIDRHIGGGAGQAPVRGL